MKNHWGVLSHEGIIAHLTKHGEPSILSDSFLQYVALMLHSIYATFMSRNPEEPVYNRIEEARTALGLSRQDLADKAGVHYQTIGYLEREEYSPSLVLALRIAKSLNQEVSDLFSLNPFKKGK